MGTTVTGADWEERPVRVADSRGEPTRFARELFAGLPDRYDRLAELLSLGQNGRWRRAMVDPVADSSPGRILDVATGPAGVALQLAARTSAFVAGVDLSPQMLRAGALNVTRSPYSARVALLIGRGEELPFPDSSFDALTHTYLLRYVADPAATLAELARVVRPSGVMAALEFHVPPNRFWHAMWLAYTRALLPIGGMATGGREWFEVGRFLGPSITEHYRRFPLDWHVSAWRSAGMADVHVRLMSLGGGLVMWARKAEPGGIG